MCIECNSDKGLARGGKGCAPLKYMILPNGGEPLQIPYLYAGQICKILNEFTLYKILNEFTLYPIDFRGRLWYNYICSM